MPKPLDYVSFIYIAIKNVVANHVFVPRFIQHIAVQNIPKLDKILDNFKLGKIRKLISDKFDQKRKLLLKFSKTYVRLLPLNIPIIISLKLSLISLFHIVENPNKPYSKYTMIIPFKYKHFASKF